MDLDIAGLYDKAVEFHGHSCPGLLSGMIIGIIALKELAASRSIDEEVVTISEGQSCMVDALQIVLGTSLGKGNLILKDYGKTAATIFDRNTGKGIRLSFDFSQIRNTLGDLREQMKEMSTEERKEFLKKIMFEILEKPQNEYLKIEQIIMKVPPEAQIFNTIICENCQEGVMATKIIKKDGKNLCISCAKGKYWQ
ncbi:MAG: TraR/DksA C4-type zinc finger protein [Candidatus Helarchaeota archaeon]|nr:TraR/DksA C4-type zinc finger protein [Candidatus Helarchaeota archaeon]